MPCHLYAFQWIALWCDAYMDEPVGVPFRGMPAVDASRKLGRRPDIIALGCT